MGVFCLIGHLFYKYLRFRYVAISLSALKEPSFSLGCQIISSPNSSFDEMEPRDLRLSCNSSLLIFLFLTFS